MIIKVLFIGNSFTDNATKYLYEISRMCGISDVTIGNLYIAGCDIDTHINNAKFNLDNYVYRKSSNLTNGIIINNPNTSIEKALFDEKWEIVVLNQQSTKAGLKEEYKNVNKLVSYVQKKLGSDIKLYWHFTWAYQNNSINQGFSKFGNDQMSMYNSIKEAVYSEINCNSYFEGIIPSGTAIQNARTSYLGDSLCCEDGYHLNYKGEFLAGLTTIYSISGSINNDINLDWVDSKFIDDIDVYLESARNAINDKFNITNSKILKGIK